MNLEQVHRMSEEFGIAMHTGSKSPGSITPAELDSMRERLHAAISELVGQGRCVECGKTSVNLYCVECFEGANSLEPWPTDEAERHRLMGRAVERAIAELPEGWDVTIELERGAGTVRVADPDAALDVRIDGGETFHEQINAAIQLALDNADKPAQQPEAPWPTDENGRLLCTKARPMPSDRDQMGQQWSHAGAAEVGDFAGYAQYRCAHCGHEWTREIPE